ncbi:hypothetical protein B0H14DRAFT_2829328, partial [Mycena olivaceomarginata]
TPWWTKVRGQSSLGFLLALAVDSHGRRRRCTPPSARSRAICAHTVRRTWRAFASCSATPTRPTPLVHSHSTPARRNCPSHSSCACSAPPRPSPASS